MQALQWQSCKLDWRNLARLSTTWFTGGPIGQVGQMGQMLTAKSFDLQMHLCQGHSRHAMVSQWLCRPAADSNSDRSQLR